MTQLNPLGHGHKKGSGYTGLINRVLRTGFVTKTEIGIDTEGQVIIHDPWTDDIIRLRDRYRKQLLRFGSYRRLS